MTDIALEMSGFDELPADSTVNIPGSGLHKLLFGIDIGPAELLLARDLNCDGVVAHHPAGGDAVLKFPAVLERQIEFLVAHGVPLDDARQVVQPMITRATMRAHAANFDQTPSVARQLQLPLMNIHLPLDEYGRRLMVETIEEHLITLDRAPLVQDAIDALMMIPDLANAKTPIMVPVGAIDNPLGKLAVVHGAGTNGGEPVAEAYFRHGVSTVLYIHCSGEDVMRLQEKANGNLIVTGHISSDMIGINAFIRRVLQYDVDVVRVSGT